MPFGHASYAILITAYNQTTHSDVNVMLSVDGAEWDVTPQELYEPEGTSHYLNINNTDPSGGNFQGWMYDGYLYIDNTFWVYDYADFDGKTVTAMYSGTTEEPGTPSPPNGTSSVGNYTFYGVNDEFAGTFLDSSIYVTVQYASHGLSPVKFLLNGQYGYNTTVEPYLFQFELGDLDREYWLSPDQDNLAIYVMNDTLTAYTLNFFDTAGILQGNTYVSAKTYVNGSLVTVERRKLDVTKSVSMNLVNGRTYQIVLENEETTYVYGDLLMTGVTFVQLTVRGVDFPKDTLLLQKYVRVYATRHSTGSVNTITVIYEDISENTASVDININYGNFTPVYYTTLYADSFTLNWNSAQANISYQLTVIAHHNTYGDLTFKQYLPGNNTQGTALFDLSFFGPSWGFNSSALLPAIIILFAAGCFSALNAEVGAILMSVTAAILTYMGWIPIPVGSIVAALALAILMALVYHKRRGGYGG